MKSITDTINAAIEKTPYTAIYVAAEWGEPYDDEIQFHLMGEETAVHVQIGYDGFSVNTCHFDDNGELDAVTFGKTIDRHDVAGLVSDIVKTITLRG